MHLLSVLLATPQNRWDPDAGPGGRTMTDCIMLGICDHRMELSDGIPWVTFDSNLLFQCHLSYCWHWENIFLGYIVKRESHLCYAIGNSLQSNGCLHGVLRNWFYHQIQGDAWGTWRVTWAWRSSSLHRFPEPIYQFMVISESIPAYFICISHCQEFKSGLLSHHVCFCHYLSLWNSAASWTSLHSRCPSHYWSNCEQVKFENRFGMQFQRHEPSPLQCASLPAFPWIHLVFVVLRCTSRDPERISLELVVELCVGVWFFNALI